MNMGADRNHRFEVRFWGVRGSYPTSTAKTLDFGGHTSCVEVRAADHCLIFDAGTGIIPLGKKLLRERRSRLRVHIFFSHTHHDHLLGFYFFEPLVKPHTELFLFGPRSPQRSMAAALGTVMDGEFFPVNLAEIKARIKIVSLGGREVIRLGRGRRSPTWTRGIPVAAGNDDVLVFAHRSPAHPKNGVFLYRVVYRGKNVVYATDIEQKRGGYSDVIEFARGADLLIHDAQYLNSEYDSRSDSRRGWGHSTVERAAEVARKAGVKKLLLFHHDPTHDDRTVRRMEKVGQRLFAPTVAACEGMKIGLL
jgi:ribonuclease BN (tRNA processing enzyme)